MSESHQRSYGKPWIRVRVHHKRTMREGWSLDETSVELVSPLDDQTANEPFDGILIEQALREAHDIGVAESNRRNQEEGIQ